MKKRFTYLILIALLAIGSNGIVKAEVKATYKKYLFNENFDALEAWPEGWSVNTESSNSSSARAIYGGAGSIEIVDQLVRTTGGNGNASRSVELKVPSTLSDPNMVDYTTWMVEIDWTINTPLIGAKNAFGLIFVGSNSTNVRTAENYVDAIFGLYISGDDGKIHYWNKDLQGPVKTAATDTDPATYYGPVFYSGEYPGFGRAGADNAATNTLNESTLTDVAYTAGATYHITAEMDFTTHQVLSLTITDKDDPANTQTITNQPFISDQVTDFSIITPFRNRATNLDNGNTGIFEAYLDNISVYVNEISLGQASVTINYLDQDGQPAKDPRVIPDQEISTTFSASTSDKNWFTNNNSYYAYDAVATADAGGEKVVVADGGSTINLKFKKSPLTPGVYNWTGATSLYWDELDNNFKVGNGDDISFQNGNGASFVGDSDNKEISITKDLTLGAGDLTVSGEGYSFTGDGKLSGTGTFKVNTSTSIGIVNNLDGGVEVTEGTLTIKNSDAGKFFSVVPGITFDLNASLNKPVTGTGGELTLLATGAYAHTATITGVDKLNYILTQKGNIPLNAAINQTSRFNNVFTGQINVSVSPDLEADTVYFGTTVQHADSKIHLGEKVTLAFTETPANPLSTVSIGELSGEASSIIGGATTAGRGVTYVIGGLNTDAEFAGSINAIPENTGPVDGTTHWGRHQLNITKEGTGTWKLTGSNPNFGTRYNDKVGVEADEKTGTFKVVAGTVELYGALGGRLAGIEVDSIGTLKGVGTDVVIGANDPVVTNGGTIAGTLTFTYNLSLFNGNIKLWVNDMQGSYEVITVGGDFVLNPPVDLEDEGNTLDITIIKATAGDKIKLIDTPNGLQGEFDNILINGRPIDTRSYTWYGETGELEALVDVINSIGEVDVVKTVQSIDYYNLSGLKVTKETTGFVIRKITYTDGSTKTTKILNPYNKK
jgi:hypothetical protein